MENLLLILATTFVLRLSSSKKIKTHYIGNTGCSIKMPVHCEPFQFTEIPKNDALYFGEAVAGNGVTYGVILTKVKEPIADIAQAEKILAQFLNSLQPSFGILHATGMEFGQLHPVSPEARGITDYWQDKEGIDWKIQGWTNGNIICIQYVRNIANLPVGKMDIYLHGFCFN